MENGINSSLCSTFHPEMVFSKSNLKVEYPLPMNVYSGFWDYSRADKSLINRTIIVIHWVALFENKTVESQVSKLNNLLLNIYSNYIPNKTVLCDPPWMTNGIRN